MSQAQSKGATFSELDVTLLIMMIWNSIRTDRECI